MTREERRLAAIVFTDIVGYSAFSEQNEALAMRLLDTHNSLVRSVMERHGGREVKTMGDSFLVEFPSALEAVRFAIEAQDEFTRSARDGRSDETISVRIGVHVGDVINRDGDLFGDAVNIASRIVEVAQGGEVCISGDVYDQVHNKVSVRFEKLPPRMLRGIGSGVDLYRLAPQADWTRGAYDVEARRPHRSPPLREHQPRPEGWLFRGRSDRGADVAAVGRERAQGDPQGRRSSASGGRPRTRGRSGRS